MERRKPETDIRALRRRRILVVEDDPDHAELLKDILLERHAFVVHAANAVECLSQDFSRFDAVLMDQNLPDATGLDLVEQILKQREIPIVMVTSEDHYEVAVRAIRIGAYDYICKAGDYLRAIPVVIEKSLEQHRLKKENARLHSELEKRLEESRSQNEALQRLSTTDYLTGLHNHRYLQERLQEEISLALRQNMPLSAVMVDIDHFKQVNDQQGHLFGDYVLKQLSAILRKGTRACDTLARYGGEEFLILLPATDTKGAVLIAERSLGVIRGHAFELDGASMRVTASFGVAGFTGHAVGSRQELVARADRALYRAKQMGRNCVCVQQDEVEIGGAPFA